MQEFVCTPDAESDINSTRENMPCATRLLHCSSCNWFFQEGYYQQKNFRHHCDP